MNYASDPASNAVAFFILIFRVSIRSLKSSLVTNCSVDIALVAWYQNNANLLIIFAGEGLGLIKRFLWLQQQA